MTGGDWIHEAMDDDSLVAQALICLLHSEPSSLPDTKCGGGGGASDLKLKWTVRQRRTKSASLRKKGDENNTRASPTTPLSWSGATSFSGGGAGAVDGFEESSGAVKLSEAVRSKGHFRHFFQGSASSPVTQPWPFRSILRLHVDHKMSLCLPWMSRQSLTFLFFFIVTQFNLSSLLFPFLRLRVLTSR
ncbi:PREDICTED: uncharacterized protein LOC104774528 isoform X2 [Camelina sativa]|uniref:Uncharacterized protein LOC104774528 isoform X2 n=1 Tax=Camelina sativa TaxID=90675 RepID=A0ABM0Y915_CAMSA|nr:PREDICTED: uncharacterized protein LOC104774528 isoform X2 [Camelina sativa]